MSGHFENANPFLFASLRASILASIDILCTSFVPHIAVKISESVVMCHSPVPKWSTNPLRHSFNREAIDCYISRCLFSWPLGTSEIDGISLFHGFQRLLGFSWLV